MKKKDKHKQKIHYIALVVVGIAAVLGAIVVERITVLTDSVKDNLISILISIGCGLFSSVAVSWLCEQKNQHLEDEKKKKMKQVLLNGFNETIEVYLKKSVIEYEDVALIIQSDFITNIPDSIKEFMLIGTYLYSEIELKYLIALHAETVGLISVIKENRIYDLFSKYEMVFYSIKETDLKHGPYAECEMKIEEICADLDMDIDERTACMIGEFFFFYYRFILSIRQFGKVFGFEKSK